MWVGHLENLCGVLEWLLHVIWWAPPLQLDTTLPVLPSISGFSFHSFTLIFFNVVFAMWPTNSFTVYFQLLFHFVQLPGTPFSPNQLLPSFIPLTVLPGPLWLTLSPSTHLSKLRLLMVRMWSHVNSHSLLTWMQKSKMGQLFWKTISVNILLPNDLSIALFGTYPNELKTYIHTKTYSRLIPNCQNMGATQMSFSRWMGKQTATMDTLFSDKENYQAVEEL